MATEESICTRHKNAMHSWLFAENLQLSNKSLRLNHKLDWPQEVMWTPSMNVNFLLWFLLWLFRSSPSFNSPSSARGRMVFFPPHY